MSHRRIQLSVLLLIVMLVGCSSPGPYEQRLYVFGTLVDITVYGVTQAKADKAINAIASDFQRMHVEWHAWEPGPLTEINQAIAAGKSVKVIPSLQPIIRQSTTLYEQSEGLFNPAIGGLLKLWGFQSSERPHGPPPARKKITEWVKSNPGMDDLSLSDDGILTSTNRAVQLDFGAFAKGYAIDLAIARLQEFGIHNAIVNAGGDLRAIGSADGRKWNIGIRHPQGEGILASLEVEDGESVFTSGNYERYREYEGVHYAHILDPRSGMPVDDIASVTVLHENGAVADAAATALVVAGVKGWLKVAKRMGIDTAMLVDSTGRVYMTPKMEVRAAFVNQPDIVIIGQPE